MPNVLQALRGARVDVWDAEFQPLILDNRWPELKGGEPRLRLEGIAMRRTGDVESKPAWLQINVPTKATVLDFPFEFTDLPLSAKQ